MCNVHTSLVSQYVSFLMVTISIYYEVSDETARKREQAMRFYGSLKFSHRNKNVSQHNEGKKGREVKGDDKGATVNL